MTDQLYYESQRGLIPIEIVSYFRHGSKGELQADVEILESVYPYEKGDLITAPYSLIKHFDRRR